MSSQQQACDKDLHFLFCGNIDMLYKVVAMFWHHFCFVNVDFVTLTHLHNLENRGDEGGFHTTHVCCGLNQSVIARGAPAALFWFQTHLILLNTGAFAFILDHQKCA